MPDNRIPSRCTASVIAALYLAREAWMDDKAAAVRAGLHRIADQFERQIEDANRALAELEA